MFGTMFNMSRSDIRKQEQEKKMYQSWPVDKEPITLMDRAMLKKYNQVVYDKWSPVFLERELRREQNKRDIVESMKRGCTIKWQVCQHKKLPEPSTAEQLIIDELEKYKVKWYRETEFLEHKKSDYGLYRYDFFLPALMLVIEYDGKFAHTQQWQIDNDKEKDKFCKKNKVRMVRYGAKDYYHMEGRIEKLMDEYSIRKK